LEFVATMTGQSLPNILKLFSSKKVTGALEIKEKDFDSSIWLKDGQIIHAFSNQASTLKDCIKILNLIPNDKFSEIDQVAIDDYHMDKFLLEKGIVQDKLITYIRSHQIAETLYSIVELEKANYELKVDKHFDIGSESLLPTTYNWLVEIYQNMYSWSQLRNKVPKNITKFKQKPLKSQELTKEEEKVYKLCDGSKNIKEVILWSSTTYFKAFSILSNLLSKGILEFEDSNTSMNSKIISEIVKVLDNMEQMPGIKTTFLVDKEGKMIAKDSRRANAEDQVNSETMAAIFSHTVSDF
jgi:hypothetical protein